MGLYAPKCYRWHSKQINKLISTIYAPTNQLPIKYYLIHAEYQYTQQTKKKIPVLYNLY